MCTKCNHQQSSVASKPLFVTHNDTPVTQPGEVRLQGYVSLGSWNKIEAAFGAAKQGVLVWDVLFEDGTYAQLYGSLTTSDVEIFGLSYRAVELVKKVLFGG